MPCSLPANESERLAALYAYQILDTPPEAVFDDLALLASQLCDTPIAAISLTDSHRQWNKARVGFAVQELPREVSCCAHVLEEPELLLIPDATQDPRVAQSPLVTGETHLRFYAGAPLRTATGFVLGSLCVIDTQPRTLTPLQQEQLCLLARQVVAQLEFRRLTYRLQEAQSVAQLGSWEEDIRSGKRVWSEELFRVLDFPREAGEPDQQSFVARIYPEDQERAFAVFEKMVAGQETYDTDLRFLRRDGTIRWMHCRGKSIKDAQGNAARLVGVTMDITERKESEESLYLIQQRLDLALEKAQLGAFYRDLDTGDYLHTTPTWRSHFGLPVDSPARYEDFLSCLHPEDRDRIAALVERAFREQIGYDTEYRCVWPDGSTHWIHVTAVPLYNSQGRVTHLSGITQEITEQKRREAQRQTALLEAQERADRDPLTGLLNHRAFHKRLEEELERARREQTPLAVVMLDTDNFKFFNDVYGHATGDAVLQRIAHHLQSACQPEDTLARFGGDEFALLLPGKRTERLPFLEGYLQTLVFQPEESAHAIPITLSLGIALFPQHAQERSALLALADEQLRRAKTGGERETEADHTRAKMRQAVEGFSMLDALVSAVDNKDRYTRRHSEDVMRYCLQLAHALGLDPETQETLAAAALLHDVGKIGVPDAILRKPGTLTESEFAAIQQHAAMGAAIVGAVDGLEATLAMIRHHHERWDGLGYPDQRAGNEIPYLARLMAVADAYSAMTTDRPYRKGLSPERAQQVLRDGAGTQWDPVLVAAFLGTQAPARSLAQAA